MITKRQLLDYYKTEPAIAEVFGISKSAVNQWGLDNPIPRERWLELKYEIKPQIQGLTTAA